MAITAADLIAPTGALSSNLLAAIAAARETPAANGTEVATTLAAAGNAKVAAWTANADAGALAWAYYQGFTERAQQILANATSASAEGEGSESFSTQQAVELQKMAARWLAEFEALEAPAETEATVLMTSRQSTNVYGW